MIISAIDRVARFLDRAVNSNEPCADGMIAGVWASDDHDLIYHLTTDDLRTILALAYLNQAAVPAITLTTGLDENDLDILHVHEA